MAPRIWTFDYDSDGDGILDSSSNVNNPYNELKTRHHYNNFEKFLFAGGRV